MTAPTIKLTLGALTDLAADSDGAYPLVRVIGPRPRIALAPDSETSIGLAPGTYYVEVLAGARDGVLNPVLVALLSGGGERTFDPVETGPGVYRYIASVERSVEQIAVAVDGAQTFVFVGAAISTEASDELPAPTVREGLVTLGRAFFRMLPLGARRALLSSPRRAAWLAKARKPSDPVGAPSSRGGRIVIGTPNGEGSAALRTDFDNRQAVARGLKNPLYVADDQLPPAGSDVRLVAFHLPQFHAIPENDAWWGKGFTEWSNVAKAVPQFLGHYQPRLPGELGFYDLRTPGLLSRQAALARVHGVGAFCFHYYWFAGKRLLEAPLDAFLADPGIDIEFCLCWANENWTRRWDGDESEVLIAQHHTTEDHARVFDDLARYMDDPRYVRIDGKPLLIVYRPSLIADARKMTALWRAEATRRGWPGVYLAATSAFRFYEPESLGFDALVEFPPHGIITDHIEQKLSWLNTGHSGSVFEYETVARAEVCRMNSARGSGIVFPGVMPGWDNEARRPGAGAIYHDATPEAYGAWLDAAVARARRSLPADRRFVFINAWNEWAEGAYLEPDRAFGRAFLVETARVISGGRSA